MSPIIYALPAIAAFVYFVLPYIQDPHGIRKYPGPFSAALSRYWLASWTRKGFRSVAVDDLHRKHGKFVRVSPNEVSIADPAALPIVYAHGNGSIKSEFYDAFVAVHPGLFNTRDRAQHARKRKIVSATFSQKNVLEFEPYIAGTVRELIAKWDGMCKKATDAKKGWAELELLDWFNALAFDIIGDLAFGTPFGMLEHDAADIVAITQEDGTVIHQPAVQILNERGEYSATQGSITPWLRPWMPTIDPWFRRGIKSVRNLTGIARTRVNERLKTGAGDRKDILAHLQSAKDGDGKPMGKDELTAEALTNLIAGSDTTSNSSCAITYYIVTNPRVHKKLVEELDKALGPKGIKDVVDYADAKEIPYLQACINEALRRHSTSGMGLPRIMMQDTEVCGEVFKAGTVLSVPSYSIHHLESVWGDPFEYRPERWLGEDAKELEKCLNVFSYGPRSCVGRNVASLELLVFICTLFYRYDFKLASDVLEVREGFLRKPLACIGSIRRRKTDA